jgi:dTDP-glucose pyrophosphorylase
MVVVIPSASNDDAFQGRGFAYSKPLVEIHGKALVEHVWSSLKVLRADCYAFVVRDSDVKRTHLDKMLLLMEPKAAIIQARGPTGGAACTALLAIEHIRPDQELVIANGDQVFACDLLDAVNEFRARDLDAGTLVFDSVHPRWSFVRVNEDGYVTEAAEKRPISRHATAGFYYFKRGRDFIDAAATMIRKDGHVNGQFYVCPVFNELILRQARIGVRKISRESYISLSTPQNIEEYETLLANRAGNQ